MTLPSDHGEVSRTSDDEWPRAFGLASQHVARLEFRSIDRSPADPEEKPISLLTQSSLVSEEEVAALREQLSCLTEQAADREAKQNQDEANTRREWEEELGRKLRQEREAVLSWLDQFSLASRRYFADVEAEVVKLALAVAARILRREALLDPLLLQGAVRVALEQITNSTEVVLRVAAEDIERWNQFSATERSSLLQIIVDDRLPAGECVLETNTGKVELGAAAQLREVERGFFDLLDKRPA